MRGKQRVDGVLFYEVSLPLVTMLHKQCYAHTLNIFECMGLWVVCVLQCLVVCVCVCVCVCVVCMCV